MKQKIMIAGLILAFMFMTGCGNGDENNYEKGISALASGDYSGALACLEDCDSNEATTKQIYRAKGMAFLSLGEYDRAKDSFIRALNESNGIIEDMDIDISYYLAVTFMKSGDTQQALRTLDSILAIDDDNDTAYYLRGKIKLKEQDKSSALEDYDKAIENNPSEYDHYLRIYEDLQSEGYSEDANVYIGKAMDLGSKLTDYRKGILEYYQGNYDTARKLLEGARDSKKKDVNLLMYLGRTYEALGDYGYAVTIYQEALNENPNSGVIYNQLAGVKISTQDYQGALETIESAFENFDGDAMQGLMYNRVIACEYMYDFENAATYMKEYLAKYPDDKKAQREYIFLSTR